MAKNKKEEFVTQIAKRDVDFPQWYTDVILKTDMVDTRRMQRMESSGKTFMAV